MMFIISPINDIKYVFIGGSPVWNDSGSLRCRQVVFYWR